MPRLSDPIGGDDAVERLRASIRRESRLHPGAGWPSDAQIAMVLHALADHTMIMRALVFDAEAAAQGPWPQATSMGRFLHAYGDRFDDEAHQPLGEHP